MAEHDADAFTRTHDCKSVDCPNAARSPVGRYSYCDDCRERRASLSTAPKPAAAPAGAGGRVSFEALVKQLATAGRNADKLAAHARKLTETALAAKANADRAAEEVRRIARALVEA